MTNILEIERAREELLRNISLPGSSRKKLLLIKSFFAGLILSKDELVKQSYLLEFINVYCEYLKKYSPSYISPDVTDEIIEQINILGKFSFLTGYIDLLEIYKNNIKEKLDVLNKSLNGEVEKGAISKLLFPVLEFPNQNNIHYNLGILDSITIEISKAPTTDKFIIIPSEAEIEERLKKQIENSWELAINYIKKMVRRKHKFYKVIIQFDERIGYYVGESLGVTLAIGFIEKLLEYYNSPYLVNIKSCIATTGGLENTGAVQRTGEEIIKRKVEIVFYSNVNTFVIPYLDETAAEQKLIELTRNYPNRKLKIVSVKDLNDLLDRRSIIEIKKQNPVVRTSKNVKRHWGVSLLLLILISLVSWFYVWQYDDNPTILENEGQILFVKNKSGKILWTKDISYFENGNYNIKLYHLYNILADVNNDGSNELLVSSEIFPDSLSQFRNRIACFDKYKNLIWQYYFKDSVRTKYEVIKPFYSSLMIGLIKLHNKNILICRANNYDSFAAAIYLLDAATGKRMNGTLWNPGSIISGIVRQTFNDNFEIICNMYNNDYERTGLFIVDFDKIDGTAPYRREEYHLLGRKIVALKAYILVSNTDYNKYYGLRNNKPFVGSVLEDKKRDMVTFCTIEGNNPDLSDNVGYQLKKDMTSIEVVIGSTLRVRRDSLVAYGMLKPPLTDTPEYCDLLKSQILYWNGKRFVKREELK